MSIGAVESKALRTALIGYGLAGSVFHAPLIESCPGLILSAVVTGNQDRRDAVRHTYPDAEALSTIDELFSNAGKYDLVVVATPNDSHANLAQLSMQNGLAVVVDKPFALSAREAEELIAVRDKTGCALSVFQNRRWDNDFLTLRDLVEKSTLGEITRLESRFERWRPQPKPGSWRETNSATAGGGLLFDLGSHLIDQALVLFGNPHSVYAELKTRRAGVQADDDSFVALQFDNDVCVHLWVSLLMREPSPRFRLLGTKGIYEKFGLDPQEQALKDGDRPGDPLWGVEDPALSGKLSVTIDGTDFKGTITSKHGSYEKFYELMAHAITHSTAVPVAAEDALRTLNIIEAARKSAAVSAAVPVMAG